METSTALAIISLSGTVVLALLQLCGKVSQSTCCCMSCKTGTNELGIIEQAMKNDAIIQGKLIEMQSNSDDDKTNTISNATASDSSEHS